MRGCEKKVYYLKKCESEWFDEAYFVLRKDAPDPPVGKDMVEEAPRIIRKEMLPSGDRPRKTRKALRLILPFFLGSVFSALVCGMVAWVCLCI